MLGRPRLARLALTLSVGGTVLTLLVLPILRGPAHLGLAATSSGGCAASRVGVAFRGDGTVLRPQPARPPVPCVTTTGFGGAETRIVVTSDGTVVYEPAILTPGAGGTAYGPGAPGPHPSTQLSPGGLATTRDLGLAWKLVEPAGQTWVPQDDQLYADRSTGRLYYYALSPDPLPGGGSVPPQDQLPAGDAHLMASPDDGRTWYHSSLPGFLESENPRFSSAPAPPGGTRPVGYSPHPTVAYWCGNNMLFTETYRACYRSLDGGVSWAFASFLYSTPVPQHAVCGTNGETFADLDPNYPQGAPDGSLYTLVSCGGATYLARSADEGATWPILTSQATGGPLTVPADGELRVDPAGNLYLVNLSNTQLLLRVSRDRGQTWGAPLNMTAPGVTGIEQWSMAERGSGEVAVSYLAHSAGRPALDGYVTVTLNGLAHGPVFWGVMVNDPVSPLMTGTPPQARDDFIGVDIGPDRTPWASFYAACSSSDPDPACVGQSSDPLAAKAVAVRVALPS